jgi:hypothetical protein
MYELMLGTYLLSSTPNGQVSITKNTKSQCHNVKETHFLTFAIGNLKHKI